MTDMTIGTSRGATSAARRFGLLGGVTALVGAPAAFMLLANAGSAGASATITVETLTDALDNAPDCFDGTPGNCSLRDALSAANGGDTITFAAGLAGTYSLTFGDLRVEKGVSIVGPGATIIDIHQTGLSRVFDINGYASDVSISGVTISGGNTGDKGGGIRAFNTGSLTLDSVVVSGNTSDGSGGGISIAAGGTGAVSIRNTTVDGNMSRNGWAGGLYLNGRGRTVTIVDSTFSNNTTYAVGGGLGVVGSGNQVTIANSTIADNSADGGGGVLLYDTNTVTFLMSTISGNVSTHATAAAGYGGGVAIQSNYGSPSDPLGAVTFLGTIISGNTSTATPAEADIALSGPSVTITLTDSLVGTSTAYTNGGGNVVSNSPGLGSLADNGGPTRTMALLAGSPAVNAGPSTAPPFTGNEWDQRGTPYLRKVGGRTDIGAVEEQNPPTPPTSSSTTSSTIATDPVVPSFTG